MNKRINLIVDERLDAWLTKRAEGMGVYKNAYIRMVLMAHGKKVRQQQQAEKAERAERARSRNQKQSPSRSGA